MLLQHRGLFLQAVGFPFSKHTGKFLLILALRQTSSKQIIKPKPFPSPMISPPLDQPTESTPPAGTQVTGWAAELHLHNKTNELCQGQSITTSSSRVLLWHRTSHTHVANCRPCMLPDGIPTLLLGGATAKSLQFRGAEQALRPNRPAAAHPPREEQPCRQAPCLGHTSPVPAPSVSELIRHLPIAAVSSKHSPYSFSTCTSSIFITQQTAHTPPKPFTSHHPSARSRLRASDDPQNLREPAGKQPRTWKHRPPEVMHTGQHKAKFVFAVQCCESKILNRFYWGGEGRMKEKTNLNGI